MTLSELLKQARQLFKHKSLFGKVGDEQVPTEALKNNVKKS